MDSTKVTCIPIGWTIQQTPEEEVIVCAPQGNPGGLTLSEKESSLPKRILFALVRAMIESDQASAKAKKRKDTRKGKEKANDTVIPWSEAAPTETGRHWFKCAETDYAPAQVYLFYQQGRLHVMSDAGITDLDIFHGELTFPSWARIEVPTLATWKVLHGKLSRVSKLGT